MGHKNKLILNALATGCLALACINANAQDGFYPNAFNVSSGNWNTGASWLLQTGTQDIPSSEYSEFAVINNNGTASVTADVTPTPLAIFIGQGQSDSGTLNISNGTLTINHEGLSSSEFPIGNIGQMVIGLQGTGTLNMSANGVLITPNGLILSAHAGATGTLKMTGGTINSDGNASIGAGGGETAIWTMEAGTFNQLTGDINIGDDNGGKAIFNMSGGQVNVTINDLDIGGDGSHAVATLSNNAKITVGNSTWIGLGHAKLFAS